MATTSAVPAVPIAGSGQVLFVHEVQRGNPVLNYIKNVKWQFSKEIVPDFVMQSTCVLFLSIRYHFRFPKHILRRIDEVGRNFRLRVLLVFVDDEENLAALTELNKIAFATNFTLIQAWSNIECARYLETFKNYENKSSSSIQSREETEFLPRLQKVLTSVRSINKTDVTTLMDVFGTMSNICQASEEQLTICPGLGGKKIKRLLMALHEPFEPKKKAKPQETIDNNSAVISHSIEDPSKKYEVPGWHSSKEDIANSFRATEKSSTNNNDILDSRGGEEQDSMKEINVEEINDNDIFGCDDEDS